MEGSSGNQILIIMLTNTLCQRSSSHIKSFQLPLGRLHISRLNSVPFWKSKWSTENGTVLDSGHILEFHIPRRQLISVWPNTSQSMGQIWPRLGQKHSKFAQSLLQSLLSLPQHRIRAAVGAFIFIVSYLFELDIYNDSKMILKLFKN